MRRLLALAALLPVAAAAQTAGSDGYGNAYVPGNVFARIARHAAPAHIAYEDADVIVFADIAPLARGHMLVVSRTSPARSLIDLPPPTLATMMATARRVMIAQRDALGATGAAILVSNGSYQSVPQLHIHVIPHYRGARLLLDAKPDKANDAELDAVVAQLRPALAQR